MKTIYLAGQPVPRMNSCAVLVKSPHYGPGTLASFKQAISEEGGKKPRGFALFLLLFLLLLFLFPCLAPSCACVSANTGAWIVEKPPAQLSSAQRSLWNGLTLCNKKIFFFFKSSITFSVSVCETVSRSDWNCSTIEITEHKQTDKRKKS